MKRSLKGKLLSVFVLVVCTLFITPPRARAWDLGCWLSYSGCRGYCYVGDPDPTVGQVNACLDWCESGYELCNQMYTGGGI